MNYLIYFLDKRHLGTVSTTCSHLFCRFLLRLHSLILIHLHHGQSDLVFYSWRDVFTRSIFIFPSRWCLYLQGPDWLSPCLWCNTLPCFCSLNRDQGIFWTPHCSPPSSPSPFASGCSSPKACVQMNEYTKTPSLLCILYAPLVTLPFTDLVHAERVRSLQGSSWSVQYATA